MLCQVVLDGGRTIKHQSGIAIFACTGRTYCRQDQGEGEDNWSWQRYNYKGTREFRW